MKAAIEDQVSTFAQKYGPAITGAGAAMTGLGATIEITKSATSLFKDQQILAATWSGIVTAATWLWNAALAANPILLVVIGIAALIAALILAYDKVGWFRNAVDDMGRVAKAAFDSVVNAATYAFNWLTQNWPLVLGILTGPFGLAVAEIATHWNTIISDIQGMPGRVDGAAVGMWDGIKAAFRNMVNGIIDIWNGLHFSLPKIDAGPIHIGGETISVPQIPHLAQGGLITQSGLVYADAGEAITPAPAGVGRPAVHVENLNVSTELDVDLFMRRAAWVARTAVM